jgi:hypothetical protein
MPTASAPAQDESQKESRSEKVAIACTPTEKRAIRAIAALRDSDESNLLRAMRIDEIVVEFERIRGETDQ